MSSDPAFCIFARVKWRKNSLKSLGDLIFVNENQHCYSVLYLAIPAVGEAWGRWGAGERECDFSFSCFGLVLLELLCPEFSALGNKIR